MKIIRRAVVLFIVFMLIAVGFYIIVNKSIDTTKIKSGNSVSLFVATDIHYLAESLTDGGEAFKTFADSGDGKEVNYIREIMSAFINDIKNQSPDVLVISGDLTTNGEQQSHIELAKELKKIEKTGTQVYVIPGNHDILNPYARSFAGDKQIRTSYIDDTDFSQIYQAFGYSEALSRDKATLSYLAAPSEDVWLLMLDTAQYKENLTMGKPQMDGRIAPDTIDWIKQCSELAKSNGAELIAVMHHNLLNHSETIRKGYTINNSDVMIELFKKQNIKLALSGHIHIQDIKSDKNNNAAIYDVATASLAMYPHKYGVIQYSSQNGVDYSTASVDVEGWAKESDMDDENLINFEEYAEKRYGDRVFASVVSRLGITDAYTSEELKLMGKTYQTMFIRYYKGEEPVVTEEIKNSQGFKLLETAQSNYHIGSFWNRANEKGEENNKLHIDI